MPLTGFGAAIYHLCSIYNFMQCAINDVALILNGLLYICSS